MILLRIHGRLNSTDTTYQLLVLSRGETPSVTTEFALCRYGNYINLRAQPIVLLSYQIYQHNRSRYLASILSLFRLLYRTTSYSDLK